MTLDQRYRLAAAHVQGLRQQVQALGALWPMMHYDTTRQLNISAKGVLSGLQMAEQHLADIASTLEASSKVPTPK